MENRKSHRPVKNQYYERGWELVTTISENDDVVTLINVFTVEPSDQQRLVDLLVTATEEVMRHRPGFVSANIHASFDGKRVVNYAQWESREDFEAIFEDDDVESHMTEIQAIADADYHLYEVNQIESS
ncbi:antibiotic biosynthesis monooxygenase family protein [Haloarcula pellucida]|uniref:antibiotic biosynthesis monooxygenase family protein n=1 Tax=Haloarcula pellucida TaxID=1427151 RepID=UPI00166B7A04|nr:antibiotic biosynthesis monooxygenase [Halomicroarcula pellucida]